MKIVILMLDSLRPDMVGCYGNSEVKTPAIDGIAAEGAVFENAYAEFPITVPARTTFLSGRYIWPERGWRPLRPEDPCLTERMKEAGLVTAAISDTPFTQSNGMDRGFDTFNWHSFGKCHKNEVEGYEDVVERAVFHPSMKEQDKFFYRNTIRNRAYCLDKFGKDYPDLLFDDVLNWIDSHHDKDFYLWVDSFAPHEPWDPPEPWRSMYDDTHAACPVPMPSGPDAGLLSPDELRHVRSMYKGCVTQTDEQVARVIERLRHHGILDDTWLFIMSDHGEPLGEHGHMRKFRFPVYDDLSRIVIVARKPDVIKPGTRITNLVADIDFSPTLLDLVKLPPQPPVDGKSWLPLFNNPGAAHHEAVFLGGFQIRCAIRTPEWKFIDNQGEKPNELYNMIEDPLELNNRIEADPALARDLHRKLWEFRWQWSGDFARDLKQRI